MKPDPIDEAIRRDRANRPKRKWTRGATSGVKVRTYDTFAPIKCMVCGEVIQKGQRYVGFSCYERHEACSEAVSVQKPTDATRE